MNDTIDAPSDPSVPPPPRPGLPPPAAQVTEPIIGGVCATLADRLGVDALWIRIGFVVLAVTSGVGLLAYIGLWLALVSGPRRTSRMLVVLGGLVLLVAVLGVAPLAITLPWLLTGTILSTGALTVVLLLAGIAVALWQPRRADLGWAPPPPSAGTPAPDATGSTTGPDDHRSWHTPHPAPPSPPRTRSRSPLGPLVLGAALLVAALGAVIDQVNGGRLHPEQWLGAAALVCGAGLLVGMVRGRARWLILPALAFAAVGFLSGEMARMGITASDMSGDRWVVPASSSGDPIAGPGAGTQSARVGVGRVVVQADQASITDGTPRPLMIDARVALGSIEVWAPDHLTILIRPRDGTPVDGYGVVAVGDGYRTGPAGPPDIVIDAWVGVGRVHVTEVWGATGIAEDTPAAEVVDMGGLTPVADLVRMTSDGWFVLGEGEALIDDGDQLVLGESWAENGGVTVIATMYGEFRLLPRGLLIDPSGAVLDLRGTRAQLVSPDEPPQDEMPPATEPAEDPDTTDGPTPEED